MSLITLISCMKSEVVSDVSSEISMRTMATPMSKASTNFSGESFGVFSFFAETEAGEVWTSDILNSATKFFSGKFIEKSDGLWGGETPYYWPLGGGTLIFAGYSPYVKSDGSTLVSVEYNPSTQGLIFEEYIVEDCNSAQSDLMYFLPETDGSGNIIGVRQKGAVNVNFLHALSMVCFNLSVMDGYEEMLQAEDVVLKSVVSKGTCTVSSGNIVSWERSGDAGNIRDQRIDNGKEALVIPGESYEIGVTYTLLLPGNDMTETVTLDIEPIPYLPGYKYIYNISIGASAIIVDTEYTEWTEE